LPIRLYHVPWSRSHATRYQTAAPIEPGKLPPGQVAEYIYEPDSFFGLNDGAPVVEMEVYHSVLELIASEQSARMVAMRNAAIMRRISSKIKIINLNKVRQEMITKEICDIAEGLSLNHINPPHPSFQRGEQGDYKFSRSKKMAKGKVVQVIGTVVDMEFPPQNDCRPSINGIVIPLEGVENHCGGTGSYRQQWVRGVALPPRRFVREPKPDMELPSRYR